MRIKALSGLMLNLLLSVGILTLTFNVQLVKASGTVYIRADGSVDPPTAPICTEDNATYTLNGDISGKYGIVVKKDNIVVDGAGYAVQGTEDEAFIGIDLAGRSNVTIKNVEIKAFPHGIELKSSSNNTISGNNIANNGIAPTPLIGMEGYGIKITCSSGNIISGNNITANYKYGILLEVGSNNRIYHNNFINNTQQVYDTSWDFQFLNASINVWEGNYWSDYEGVDYTGDGIGDSPYVIYEKNRDNHPLMSPWTPTWRPTPFWMQWWFWAIVIAGIAVLAATVYLLKKRKPPTPAAPPPPPEGTLQNIPHAYTRHSHLQI